MNAIPQVRFVEANGSYVAYQVFGSGPPDLLIFRAGVSHLEMMWEHPRVADFLQGLAKFARVIVKDPRGFGLSDPVEMSRIGHWEDSVADAISVAAAVGSERSVVVGLGIGATAALLLAATHPTRVSSLVLVNGLPRAVSSDDYPWGIRASTRERILRLIAEGRFPPAEWDTMGPPGWSGRFARAAASPGVWRAVYESMTALDVRHVLEAVRVPTLCLATTSDRGRDSTAASEDLAEKIPEAELRVVDVDALSSDWLIFDRPEPVAKEIQGFVTGVAPPVATDRFLAAVLFTDIVASTEAATDAGDAAWRRTLDSLDVAVVGEAGRYGGRVVKQTGDGHLLTFDAPSRAILCGQAIRDAAMSRLGIPLRTGLHIGEVERRGEDIAGIAVAIARRVCDLAEPGQILVSHAIPQLVAGASISFTDKGTRQLKGVPGEWTLHEVV